MMRSVRRSPSSTSASATVARGRWVVTRAAIRRATAVAMSMATAIAGVAVAQGAVPPDRGDLARGYQRFDALAVRAPDDPVTRRTLNLGFDGLTADFFAGRYGRALEQLARIEADHRGVGEDARAGLAFLATHRVEQLPAVVQLVDGVPASLRIRVVPLADASASARDLGRPRDDAATGESLGPRSLTVSCGDFSIEIPVSEAARADGAVVTLGPGCRAGAIVTRAELPQLGSCEVSRSWATTASLETRAAELRARATAVDFGRFEPSVQASFFGRLALLPLSGVDRTRSATLLCDVPRLLRELDAELDALTRGSNPYARRGELWRVYRALGVELPTRQFVPEGAGPFPLVVAFHGAGGDENMFFDGYGAGMLRELAQKQGFAVVCPPTVPFGLSGALFDRFIDEVAKDMPIDRGRILLLGHSMGAITASRLAGLRADAVAGAACIAGFLDASRGGMSAPRAVYLGALDPIFPIEPIRVQIAAARGPQSVIEVVTFDHEGHTLVVDRALPQTVDWLLARPARTTDTTKPTISAPSTRPMNTGVPAPAAIESSPSAGPTK